MTNIRALGVTSLLLGLLAMLPMPAPAEEAAAKPSQFLYVLRVAPRFHDEKVWTDADHAAVSKHFKRLQDAAAKGQVVLAGRTNEPLADTFGLVIFEAVTEDAARRFMEEDPAVQAGVMTATLHPYAVAVQRTP